MNLPTFIVGGAQRSATTYLYELCDAHPRVFMAKPQKPEPKFFAVDAEYRKGLSYYAEKYFSRTESFQAVGEKSTIYLENSDAAERIRKCLPDVSLVFVLRNPVERAFSNYRFSRSEGVEALSFEEALQTEAHREASYSSVHEYARPFSYLSRGLYAKLLKPYYAHFDPARIKVFLLDDMVGCPEVAACELFDFLGVSIACPDIDLARKVNSARGPSEWMSPWANELLRDYYAEPNRELAELISRDLSRWDRSATEVSAGDTRARMNV